MRRLSLVALALAVAAPAFAELQNVTLDGSVRIRGNYYTATVPSPAGAEVRWPGFLLPRRPIGSLAGGNTIVSLFSWNDDDNTLDFVEQRTRLGVKADFSDNVGLYIELDSYDVWGDGSFRSAYLTGADVSTDAAATDDVALYQAYIEAKEMWGTPLCVKVGRQELKFGSGWLVGTNDASSFFQGLSFDAIRATYGAESFSVDAFAAHLAEGGVAEQDDDIMFYGLYASCTAVEDITFDAYWLWLRDATLLNDTAGGPLAEWLEDVVGVDDYDPTNIHTVGLRGAGTYGAFDFEAEAAYQFGNAGTAGILFPVLGAAGPFPALFAGYGDDDAEYGELAANLEVGYTFDMSYNPRVYLGLVYFGGEDNRDVSFWEWLNPFYRGEASVSFNRLFSNWEYSEFIANTDESNMWMGRAGVRVNPTESTELLLSIMYCQTLEEFDTPRYISLGRFRVPILPGASFWTQETDSTMGWEVGLYGSYAYSEDLKFNAGIAHFFLDDAGYDGQFTANNGLAFVGGSSDDDPTYIFLESTLKF